MMKTVKIMALLGLLLCSYILIVMNVIIIYFYDAKLDGDIFQYYIERIFNMIKYGKLFYMITILSFAQYIWISKGRDTLKCITQGYIYIMTLIFISTLALIFTITVDNRIISMDNLLYAMNVILMSIIIVAKKQTERTVELGSDLYY